MLIGVLTVIMMGACAYAYWREGPLTAFAMCVNILLAGILAFNFWEPIADLLEPAFGDSAAHGIEDGLALMLVFLPCLALLRLVTNNLARTHLQYPAALYHGGAVVCGLLAGYLLAGFLVCAIQTLPLERDFLGFDTYRPGESSAARKILPPDLVWLAMMHRLSGGALSAGEDRFDRHCNYELRYSRYRRTVWDEKAKEDRTLPYRGELEP